MKKRTIAIVAGGDSSELPVSLRSAQGIYSFIDKPQGVKRTDAGGSQPAI